MKTKIMSLLEYKNVLNESDETAPHGLVSARKKYIANRECLNH